MNLKRLFCAGLYLFLSATLLNGQHQVTQEDYIWKVGVAKQNITPKTAIWLAGYASRTSPSDGKLHDIWAKAVTLEDASGHRAILITMDLLGIPKQFSDDVRDEIQRRHGLERSQIILSSSHTHSGPVLTDALKEIYPMSIEEWEVANKYTKELSASILQLTEASMKNLQPSRIYSEHGITRFQVNRRNNREGNLKTSTTLSGPNDYDVPVIKIEGLNKKIIAIIFGYACHPTTLIDNKISGDYAGFAQIELEKRYKGTTALFFQGAGGDQNPIPRRSIPLAKQYGQQLAATVERVLSEDMSPQKSRLATQYKEIDLPFGSPYTTKELETSAQGDDYQSKWAHTMLDQEKKQIAPPKTYPYPIGKWQIGDQQLFILGGESVISYSVALKELYGESVFVMSYANDVMGYIPSEKIIEEGGYEGNTSQRVYGLPTIWDRQIESIIIDSIKTFE